MHRSLIASAFICLGWVAVSPATELETFGGVRVAPARLDAGTARRAAPECDRAFTVNVNGVTYAVGTLHNRWRVAVASYTVTAGQASYRLFAAFDRTGALSELYTDPPDCLKDSRVDACDGLTAAEICSRSYHPQDPFAFLSLVASHFARIFADGGLERAVAQTLHHLDTVTGATP